MPFHKCPFPKCTFETADVSDSLAATLLQIHASGAHVLPPPSTAPSPSVKADKVRRPTVTVAGSSEEWSYFLTRWQDYKDATKITGKDVAIQLMECCDETLRKDLTRSAGGSLTSLPEDKILAAMKTLAVREENTMVARASLYEMRQDHDEFIRSFGARIQGQAGVCKYTLECPSCKDDVNYTNQILRDVLIRGIADHEIQLDILGHSNQDLTLEEAFRFIEAKEAGKRSASKLISTQGMAASGVRSQYKRIAAQDLQEFKRDNKEPCSYCGKQGHGRRAPPTTRKTKCPAYDQTCTSCGRLHHISKMCRSKNKPIQRNGDQEAATFQELCSLSNDSTENIVHCSVALDHHIYSSLNNCWNRRPSQSQPEVFIA